MIHFHLSSPYHKCEHILHGILEAKTTTSKGDEVEWDYNCYITNMKPQPRLLKTFQLNEGIKKGTQDEREREIIKASKMVRNQRRNPR
jgi:hypothetical protein